MTRGARLVVAAVLVALMLGGEAGAARRKRRRPPPPPPPPITLESAAESYVRLALALGAHDPDFVDAYYGPPTWKAEAEAAPRTLDAIRAEAASIAARLDRHPPQSPDSAVHARHRFLARQLHVIHTRTRMLAGTRFSFDEETRALYDAVAPVRPDSTFDTTLAAIDRLLPGQGALVDRYEAFRKRFVVPPARLDAVFKAAIGEARARTLRHLTLPPDERFTVEYVTGKSWSGYNWYQGGYRSVIQVNTDLPIHIDHVVELAAHEGYPGHHVANVLIDRDLVKGRGWVEFALFPLFSPLSLIGEGTADFGVEVAFPDAERARFERSVLYPLAGLDTADAERYDRVQELVDQLAYAGTEAARRYLNRRVERAATIEWLGRHALHPRAWAERQIAFYDQYRSYTINYTLGEDLVRHHVESRGGTAARPDVRWRELVALLATPKMPSELE